MRSAILIFLLLVQLAAEPVSAAPPQRVVSMNLCTDQLAMMLAAPEQLISVSEWSLKPSASNMVEAARGFVANAGSAEQIFLMKPDLVLAGDFSSPMTLSMLRRLGIRVETLSAATSIAEIARNIRQIGGLLGRAAKAEQLVTEFDAALMALTRDAAGLPPEDGAYHYANNYTSGAGTLASEIMERAGLENVAARLGLKGVTQIDLETLVMERPFLIRSAGVSGSRIGRSFDSLRHPALAPLHRTGGAELPERLQVCGTPFVAEAIARLIGSRRALASN